MAAHQKLALVNCVVNIATLKKINGDNAWGNAYQINTGIVKEELVSASHCSPTTQYMGDSAIGLIYCKSNSSEINISKCNGFSGGGMCVYNNEDTVGFKYSSICDVYDYSLLEAYNTKANCAFINFINSTKCSYAIYSNQYVCTFSDCIFIDMCATLVVSNNFDCISLTRCFFNAPFSNTVVQTKENITENINFRKYGCNINICSLKISRRQPISILYYSIMLLS